MRIKKSSASESIIYELKIKGLSVTGLLYLLFSIPVFSQVIEPFPKDEKYGIKNKITGRVLIPAKYNKILNYNDTTIIVQSRNFMFGAIDTLDNIIVPFTNDQLYIDTYSPGHLGQIMEVSYSVNNPKFSAWCYVDKNRNCIPYDYSPCPSWKRIIEDSVQLYHYYVQNGLISKSNGQRDSIIYWIDKAIALEPKNPFLYFFKADLLTSDNKNQFSKDSDTIDYTYKRDIETCLNTALSLEERPVYLAQIINRQYLFYKYCLQQKAPLRELENIAKKNDFIKNTYGLFFIGGFAYNNGYEVEAGLGWGEFSINNKQSFKPLNVNSLILIGGSWIKNLTEDIDGYKIYLFSILKPLRFGICPIYYTNYRKHILVLRPELGYGFNFFTVSAGYNIIVKEKEFQELSTFNLNLRYYLPLSVNESFSIQQK